MSQTQKHVPVLLREALEGLAIRPDGRYIDGTFGRGGHSAEIMKRLGPQGGLMAIDRDVDAVAHAEQLFSGDARFSIEHGGFSGLLDYAQRRGWAGRVDGVLLDLGVSSPQLDQADRGFSFMQDGPLDMRMDRSRGESAADWLAHAEEGEIVQVLREYGEERFARRIAGAILRQREQAPLERTAELAALIEQAVPRREKHKHPATRSFQAIRIHVNRELDELQQALQGAVQVLADGGRLAVISFHSLEDRIVKRFMREQSRGPQLPKGVPVRHEQVRGTLKLVGKAIFAGEVEVAANPRARSAVLRVAERQT